MIGLNDALDSSSSEDDDDNEELPDSNVFIKHIRRAFIATDDSSYSEYALMPDLRIFDKETPEVTFGRRPLNDTQLEKLLSKRIETRAYEYAKVKKNNKTQTNKPNTKANDEPSKIFNNKEFDLKEKDKCTEPEDTKEEPIFELKEAALYLKKENLVSPLTLLLKNKPVDKNPFSHYSKFEPLENDDPTLFQKLRIFLPLCDIDPRVARNSINVKVLKTARISELIGLICFKYTTEKKEPPLKFQNVNDYILKIADDDGDVESELSALESFSLVGRFGFNDLALLEKQDSPTYRSKKKSIFSDKICVKIHFTDDTPAKQLIYEFDNIPMQKIYDELLKTKIENSKIFCPIISYRMEHKDEPGVAIDINTSHLNHFKSYEFYFFRENSIRKESYSRISESSAENDPTRMLTEKITEHSEYDVTYLSKWRKVPFKIELSKDSFELEEIKPVKISQLRLKNKNSTFYTIPMKYVVSCFDLKENFSDKPQIRVIVAEDDNDETESVIYKHLDFECEPDIAEDIKSTFSQLIMYSNSQFARTYDELVNKTSFKWSRRLFKLKLKNKFHANT